MYINFQNRMVNLLRRVALALTLAAGCGAASASMVHVSIDTSTFGVANGFIDLEFGAAGGVPLATAVVTNLVGFAPTPDIEWGVEQVTGGYKFRNDTVNLLSHAANFGGYGHSGFTQREPDPALRPFWEPLEAFNRFVVSAKPDAFSHPQTGIGSWLDLDNAYRTLDATYRLTLSAR